MDTSLKENWYDKKGILILLLFLFPPVGIVGIFLHKTDLWKKLVYTFGALAMSLVLLVITIAVFNPINYYESGNRYFEDGNYQEAIKEYKKIDSDNKDYQNAMQKIELAHFKLDSISKVENLAIEKQKQDATAENEKLIAFQKQWADSIVKSWEGSYIVSNKLLKNTDTIYFQLSKNATQGNWISKSKPHQEILQNNYNNSLKKKIGVVSINTIIAFLPDSLQIVENNKLRLRKEKIASQFSIWDGSHRNLVKYIKQNLHDPNSFKHQETIYEDKGDYVLIEMSYRAKNKLGAMVLETVVAKADLKGNILSANQIQ
ncbi:hypothetical protein [Psychroflexus sp. MBR-150]